MTPRSLTALALMTGLLFASTGTAYAQAQRRAHGAQTLDGEEEDPEPEVSAPNPYDRMLAVSLNGGLDTPFGVVGGAIEFAPIQYLNIFAGGGVSRSGARFSGGVALRFPVHSTSFGIRAGVAGGPMSWTSAGARDGNISFERYWEFALFAHTALDLEYRFDEGLFIRVLIGMETLVAGDTTACTASDGSTCPTTAEGIAKPLRGWAGLSVGYAFEL